MKLRFGFVSNSSTSNVTMIGIDATKEIVEAMMNDGRDKILAIDQDFDFDDYDWDTVISYLGWNYSDEFIGITLAYVGDDDGPQYFKPEEWVEKLTDPRLDELRKYAEVRVASYTRYS